MLRLYEVSRFARGSTGAPRMDCFGLQAPCPDAGRRGGVPLQAEPRHAEKLDRGSEYKRRTFVFKRLLVPLDGTRRSASIVPLAVQIALGFGCSVRLLSVVVTRRGESGALVPKGGVGVVAGGCSCR